MSKIAPIFNGRVEQGKLSLYNRERFQEYIQNIQGDVIITVRKKRKIRSLNQNSYYWCCLNIAADELGYDSEELHQSFKAIFLTDHTTKIPLIRSTTKLNTNDFSLYLDKVLRKLAELQIIIPTPEEYFQSKV